MLSVVTMVEFDLLGKGYPILNLQIRCKIAVFKWLLLNKIINVVAKCYDKYSNKYIAYNWWVDHYLVEAPVSLFLYVNLRLTYILTRRNEITMTHVSYECANMCCLSSLCLDRFRWRIMYLKEWHLIPSTVLL